MHELLNDSWTYSPETHHDFALRYSGFGRELYKRMATALPDCHAALRYFRADCWQTDDSFAVCSIAHPFAVQLDPDCEVICLWDERIHVEIGTWSAEPYKESSEFIRRHFTSHAPNPPLT